MSNLFIGKVDVEARDGHRYESYFVYTRDDAERIDRYVKSALVDGLLDNGRVTENIRDLTLEWDDDLVESYQAMLMLEDIIEGAREDGEEAAL